MTFIEWLTSRKDENSPVGDLAADTIRSGFMGTTAEELRFHLRMNRACTEAHEALREAQSRWRYERPRE